MEEFVENEGVDSGEKVLGVEKRDTVSFSEV